MKATVRAILGGLLAIGLLLVLGWLGWFVTGGILWEAELVVALTLLFLIRLRAHWRPQGTVAEDHVVEVAQGRRRAHWRTTPQPLQVLRAVARKCSRRFEFIIFALLAAAVLYQVVVPPVVGLADNGDFEGVMSPAGLEYIVPSSGDDPEFINRYFLSNQPHSFAAGYISSELVFVESASLLSTSVSADKIFDLRTLGAFHAAAFLAVLLLVLNATRYLPKVSRWVSVIMLLVVFTDVGYVAYFNSFYREPAALIFLVLTIACAIHLICTPKAHLSLLLGYFAAAALFVTAQPQYAPQGALLAVFGLILTRRWWRWWPDRHSKRKPWWRFKRRRQQRLGAVGMALTFCLIGPWSYFWQPDPPREATLHNLVFSDLLVRSPAPEADLNYLGLDPGLDKWIGSEAFDEEDEPLSDPAFKENFFAKVTPASLINFYATHPGMAIGTLDRAAKQGLSLRPAYLGNFEEASGFSPLAQIYAFDGWSNVRESFPSKSLAGFLVVFGLAMVASIRIRRQCATLQGRMLAELFILLLVMAAVEFVVACLSGGALDLVKNLFAFNLLVDIGAIMAVSYAAKWWTDIIN
jgi:hypothetical protein